MRDPAELTRSYDCWLRGIAAEAGIGDGGPAGIALVALGGLGRREFVPHSDLDLLLLHEDRQGCIVKVAEALWYPIWDAGVGLDHAVRTPEEALELAGADLRVAIGLLDARHLAGDAELTARFAGTARTQWRRGVRARMPELAESARQRWRRSGELAQSAAPDLKNARGGLRDLVLLDALAAAQLGSRPRGGLTGARELLLDVRAALRGQLGRARDVLPPELAVDVARELGFDDRFQLARALSGAGRRVTFAIDTALRSTAGTRQGRRPARKPLTDGVVLHDEEVALAHGAEQTHDPALPLRVATASARSGQPIARGTLRAMTASAPELRQPWPAAVRQALIELLGAGEGLLDAVEALEQHELWQRLLPEWDAVRDLPPREPVHAWTVDRHLLLTCVHAAAQRTGVRRPDLLLLGALLHDIGKGRAAEHSEVGADIAAAVARRIGLPEADVALVVGMVRHHLLLPHVATRRDISDPATIAAVVETMGERAGELLELLSALVRADSTATGTGVWSEWKEGLITDLVRRCQALCAGHEPARPEPLGTRQRQVLIEAVRWGQPRAAVEAEGSLVTAVFATPEGTDPLATAAGVLALHSLEVHMAQLHRHSGGRLVEITASPRFGTPPAQQLLHEQFGRAVAGTLPLRDKLAAKERDYRQGSFEAAPAQVAWPGGGAGDRQDAVLELRAGDRIGLLYRVAEALRGCQVEVAWAKVLTLGGVAVDSFAVCPTADAGAAWWADVERAVLAAAG